MSLAIAASSTCYSPAADSAMSPAGAELRDSIESALTPPRKGAEDDTIALLTRVNAALKKGMDVEGVLVDVDSFGRMFDVLRVLPPDIPIPDIVVESEHEIGLD